ncbi:MAG: hypothetical protein Q8M03_16100 [Legionella sp.]|nr:hypothetical protein [Legionella sp.]
MRIKLDVAKRNRLANDEAASERCASLICLKRAVANASASFGQLEARFFFDGKRLRMVRNIENELKAALKLICIDNPIPQEQLKSLTNAFDQLASVKNSGWEKFSSSFNFSLASVVTVLSVVGIYYSAAMVYSAVATLAIGMAAGPFGLLAVGLALTFLLAATAIFAAYAAYVEVRFLVNKQLNEISECIDLLKDFSDDLVDESSQESANDGTLDSSDYEVDEESEFSI